MNNQELILTSPIVLDKVEQKIKGNELCMVPDCSKLATTIEYCFDPIQGIDWDCYLCEECHKLYFEDDRLLIGSNGIGEKI